MSVDFTIKEHLKMIVLDTIYTRSSEAKSLSKLIMGDDGEMTVLEFCDFAGLDFMKVEELLQFEKRNRNLPTRPKSEHAHFGSGGSYIRSAP